MALISLNMQPSRRELRQFAGIWFPAFWLVVGWLAWKTTANPAITVSIWSLAALVSVVGFLVPEWMRYVFVGWMWATYPIGWLIAHLLLAVVYYMVLTPIGLTLRALGRDPLERDWNRGCSTYWQPHTSDEEVAQYFRQY